MNAFTVAAALRQAQELLATAHQHPRRDAEILLRHVLGRNHAWMIANSDATLALEQYETYKKLLERRQQHEPVQYILGEQEFFGLRFEVSSAVLIPRPETEHLVEAVLARWPVNTHARVADVGTGSGAIAVSLAHARPLFQIAALDMSLAALHIAARNAEAHSVSDRVRFLESDLLAAVAGESFDIIVSNPPYVPSTDQLEPQVRDWEPHTALFAGEDGLAIYRRLIPQAWDALVPGGWLLLEIGHGQREAVQALLERWESVRFVPDLQGIARVAVARKS